MQRCNVATGPPRKRKLAGMVHFIGNIPNTSPAGVERIAERSLPPTRAAAAEPATPQDLLAYDSVKVASISDLAGRSTTFRMAIRNLDEIDAYLNAMT